MHSGGVEGVSLLTCHLHWEEWRLTLLNSKLENRYEKQWDGCDRQTPVLSNCALLFYEGQNERSDDIVQCVDQIWRDISWFMSGEDQPPHLVPCQKLLLYDVLSGESGQMCQTEQFFYI